MDGLRIVLIIIMGKGKLKVEEAEIKVRKQHSAECMNTKAAKIETITHAFALISLIK